MCKFKVHLIAVLLTFGIGVSAVSVWYQYQTPQEIQVTSIDVYAEPTPHIQKNLSNNWEEYFGTPLVWKFLLNDEEYGKLAVVRAPAITLNGTVKAKLRLDCPSTVGSIQILVGDMEETGFNLANYSVSSELPIIKKNIVEVRAVSPKGKMSFKTKANGNIGYPTLYPTVIFFELIKTKRLEHLIAKGSTEVTFVVHDIEDYKKTITVTFPAIDSSSQMAKDFKGCRQ
jgi:hypothetical protein